LCLLCHHLNRPQHPEDQPASNKCPIYRDSFLGLFDEAHPLYPKDSSPAGKGVPKLPGNLNSGGKTSFLKFPHSNKSTADLQHTPPPGPQERTRTTSVMKRAQSLGSLASLVTSGDSNSAFTVRLSPMRGATGDPDAIFVDQSSTAPTADMDGHTDPGDGFHSPTAAPLPCVDITEQPWFQNERNGSLDQTAFEYVQKQLFEGNEMAERRKSSTMSVVSPGVNLAALAAAAASVPSELQTDAVQASTTKQDSANSPMRAPQSPFILSMNSSSYRTATPPKSFSPAPYLTASNSPSAVPKYMDSPSLRRYRSKSEENVVSRPSEHSASASGAIPQSMGDSGRHQYSGGPYSPTASARSLRAEALLEASKVDAHFFSSSSDEEGQDSEDDLIPHIIPLDLQSMEPLDSAMSGPYADAIELSDHSRHLSAETGDNDSELAGLDLMSSPESVRSRVSGGARRTPDMSILVEGLGSPGVAKGSAQPTPEKMQAPYSSGQYSVPDTPPNRATPAWLVPPPGSNYVPSPGPASNAATPPPRSKHSREYLVEAGLLKEATAHHNRAHRESSSAALGPGIGASQPGSRQRPGMLFPPSIYTDEEPPLHPPQHPHRPPTGHSPQHSYSQRSGTAGSPRTPSGSRDTRSYSRQSIEEILHNALTERDTEGSLLAPSQSRFSFQASSNSIRQGECYPILNSGRLLSLRCIKRTGHGQGAERAPFSVVSTCATAG
jgi:hypothetical protein